MKIKFGNYKVIKSGGIPDRRSIAAMTAVAEAIAEKKGWGNVQYDDKGGQAVIFLVQVNGNDKILRLDPMDPYILSKGIDIRDEQGYVNWEQYCTVRNAIVQRYFDLTWRLVNDEDFQRCPSLVSVQDFGCMDVLYVQKAEEGLRHIQEIQGAVYTLMDRYQKLSWGIASKEEAIACRNEAEVLRCGIDICDALILLHSAGKKAGRYGQPQKEGIAHSDISCDNIMMDPQTGHYVLIDLGTLRLRSSKQTETFFAGKSGYLDPASRMRNNAFRLRRSLQNDLYSLSVVLYTRLNTIRNLEEVCCLPEPERFREENGKEKIYRGAVNTPKTTVTGMPPIHSDVAQFLVRQLSYRMEKRPCKSAAAYRKALENLQKKHGYLPEITQEEGPANPVRSDKPDAALLRPLLPLLPEPKTPGRTDNLNRPDREKLARKEGENAQKLQRSHPDEKGSVQSLSIPKRPMTETASDLLMTGLQGVILLAIIMGISWYERTPEADIVRNVITIVLVAFAYILIWGISVRREYSRFRILPFQASLVLVGAMINFCFLGPLLLRVYTSEFTHDLFTFEQYDSALHIAGNLLHLADL